VHSQDVAQPQQEAWILALRRRVELDEAHEQLDVRNAGQERTQRRVTVAGAGAPDPVRLVVELDRCKQPLVGLSTGSLAGGRQRDLGAYARALTGRAVDRQSAVERRHPVAEPGQSAPR
jgi:hypothetical protein